MKYKLSRYGSLTLSWMTVVSKLLWRKRIIEHSGVAVKRQSSGACRQCTGSTLTHTKASPPQSVVVQPDVAAQDI
ncbi:hypothetical protein [Undibacterium sp. Ji49W]|uniref:hypothetical protein n=1 Tax=Undibacterium sp. Ji49W TaxID=3413040 RepID=UPI003BEFCCAB